MPHNFRFLPVQTLALCALSLLSACLQKSESPSAERSPAPPPPPGMQRAANSDGGNAKISTSLTNQFEDAAANGDIFSSAAAMPSSIDLIKKFVRTAEMRFRVNNTPESTIHIEDIALRHGGFVVSSNLNTQVEMRQTTPVSRDSAIETTRFSVHCQLVIRVPYQQLDTTLRSIGRLSDFLDLRHVSAEDVGLQMLEQELARIREGIYRTDLDNSDENKDNPKADRARESLAATDQARIETLKLEDAIKFSTVRVDIYQLPQVGQTRVANTDAPIPQRPFFARLGDALTAGGEVLTEILLAIVHLWSVILLAVAGYFGWKIWRKRKA